MIGILLVGSMGQAAQGLKDVFETREYRYSGGQYQQELFRYRLFVPSDLKPGECYPLLVWLHGLGESGSDNERSLRWLKLILSDLDRVAKYRYFVLVVQCPAENPYWYRGYANANEANAGDMAAVAFAVLQKTMREEPVDQDRVYLSGVSSGGSGCWEMATRYPETFAAVVPMGSGGGDVSRVNRLVDVPIWAVHSNADEAVSPDGVKETVAVLQAAGGNAHLTLFNLSSHDCWSLAFRRLDLMGWMLEQRRDRWMYWYPPGCKPWKWWHILAVPGTVVMILVIARNSERRRRRFQIAQRCQAKENDIKGDN